MTFGRLGAGTTPITLGTALCRKRVQVDVYPEEIDFGSLTAHVRLSSPCEIRAGHRVTGGESVYHEFENDPFDEAETTAEAKAQIDRFVELMGRSPAYVHHHSLVSPTSDQVVRAAAESLKVPFVDDLYRTGGLPLLPNDWYTKPFSLHDQAGADAAGAIERLLPSIMSHPVSLLIVHPGYVDAELLDISSYSVVRAHDLELVTSPAARALLEESGVEMTTFSAERLR